MKLPEDYKDTIKFLITSLYSGQVQRSKRRGHPKPAYSKEEFRDWLLAQTSFTILLKAWKASNYTGSSPSVNRLRDSESYTFNNIEITTWKKNLEQEHKRTDKANNKIVTQMRNYGTIVATFESVAEASRQTSVNADSISACCRNKRQTAGGYRWKY